MPDIGAYEYIASGYDFTIALTNLSNGTIMDRDTTISAVADNPDLIRYVIFYIDGIPAYKDIEPSYSYVL
ncbi:MAG: hypothetical protein QXK37_00155 [Candidatus Woesearchaeota archaeon]